MTVFCNLFFCYSVYPIAEKRDVLNCVTVFYALDKIAWIANRYSQTNYFRSRPRPEVCYISFSSFCCLNLVSNLVFSFVFNNFVFPHNPTLKITNLNRYNIGNGSDSRQRNESFIMSTTTELSCWSSSTATSASTSASLRNNGGDEKPKPPTRKKRVLSMLVIIQNPIYVLIEARGFWAVFYLII